MPLPLTLLLTLGRSWFGGTFSKPHHRQPEFDLRIVTKAYLTLTLTQAPIEGAAISNGGPKGGRRLLQKKQASTEAKESCEFGFTDSGEGPDWWCADSTIDGVVYTGAVPLAFLMQSLIFRVATKPRY